MNDVQRLRELILGLAIVTPIGCQSPAPAADPDPKVEQTRPTEDDSEVEAGDDTQNEAEASEDRDQAPDEVVDETPPAPPVVSAPPNVVNAALRAEQFVDISKRRAHQVTIGLSKSTGDMAKVVKEWPRKGVRPMATHDANADLEVRCLDFEQVYDVQKALYDTQYERWKSYGGTSNESAPPMPRGVYEPTKPSRKMNACPDYVTTHVSYSRCGSNSTTWSLSASVDVGKETMCCFVEPPPLTEPRRPCGRLFFVEERATRAETRRTRAWMGDDVEAPGALDEDVRERAARAWLEDALEEHASIAAFSRATLELMALGAPADLLAQYQRASLEEIRHAKLCFALVSALTGEDASAGAIEVEGPRGDLDAIIADVFWGGCVGESVAALCARRAMRACDWEPARAALEEIARDEASHAALAWSTLSFLGGVMPERVRRVLSEVERPEHAASDAEEDASWNALGRLTPSQDARAARDAWEQLIEPMLGELLA